MSESPLRRGATAVADARAPAAWTVTATSIAEARAHVAGWQRLSERAVEPNVFYEPWNLLAAMDTVLRGRALRLVFVYLGDGDSAHLAGLFPLELRRHYKGMPARCLTPVRHLHCFLCTPLVDATCVNACLDAFARWVAAVPGGVDLLDLHTVSGTLADAMIDALRSRSLPARRMAVQERALFRPAADADGYLRQALPGKTRKEFRRLKRRLSEHGHLEFRVLGAGENAARWIGDFLHLEQRGWKGRSGTAMTCDAAERDYFRQMAQSAQRAGKLEFTGLFLDGDPVAMSCKVRSGAGLFAFKIAFDEHYSRYSPGTLLELECVVRAHQRNGPAWMDSCADPGHFMANRLWFDRRRLVSALTALSPWGRLLQFVTQLAYRTRCSLRQLRRGQAGPGRQEAAP